MKQKYHWTHFDSLPLADFMDPSVFLRFKYITDKMLSLLSLYVVLKKSMENESFKFSAPIVATQYHVN